MCAYIYIYIHTYTHIYTHYIIMHYLIGIRIINRLCIKSITQK